MPTSMRPARAEAALIAMAASVRLRVVELEIETRSVLATGRHREV